MNEKCNWCGGEFGPAEAELTHPYMLSTPGCWAAFGSLCEREYSDPALFDQVHRLSVDSYAFQHPGDPADSRARQSVWIHGVALWLVYHHDFSHQDARKALAALAGQDFEPLPVPPVDWPMTHAEVMAAPLSRHASMVREWSHSALKAWDAIHPGLERISLKILS